RPDAEPVSGTTPERVVRQDQATSRAEASRAPAKRHNASLSTLPCLEGFAYVLGWSLNQGSCVGCWVGERPGFCDSVRSRYNPTDGSDRPDTGKSGFAIVTACRTSQRTPLNWLLCHSHPDWGRSVRGDCWINSGLPKLFSRPRSGSWN